MSRDAVPLLAAIRYQAGTDINRIIREVVTDLQEQGIAVGGVLQEIEAGNDPTCARLNVVDIRTGATASITQDRGKDAQGCKLDPRGLADISHCITDAIEVGVALMVVNKFGRAESEGGGLLSCIAESVSVGIPILTSVREPYIDAWRSFHGGLAVELPPRKRTIVDWCRASCRQSQSAE